jgi:hypothetical protein
MFNMCSGEYLENQVKEFCSRNQKDEGQTWQIINNIHTKDYGRNIMTENQTYEKENKLGDIPMSQYFAKVEKVSNAIRILKGMQNCINNNWGLE